jgi:hypothetical protein
MLTYFLMSFVSVARGAEVEEVPVVDESLQPTTAARIQTARQDRIRFFIFGFLLVAHAKDRLLPDTARLDYSDKTHLASRL